MALAPLSQTILLTEDGSVIPVTEQVIIPPARLPPPVITTPADIASNGTPQVGEQLTGIDPVATFATYGNRRWLRGETVLARTIAYTPRVAGDIDWVVDVIGTDGVTVLTSGKRVTVAAISAPDPTLANTLADSNLPISAVPGLLDRINALDDRLTALGLAAVDPDVADAIAAVLVDLAEAIDAIDLHRTLAVVLPALEAAMTQLEEAAQNPNPQPGQAASWYIGDPSVFVTSTGRFIGAGGGGTTPGAITLTVGAITPGTEGSGVTGITLTVGSIGPANEGTGSAITLTVGSIAASGEGSPSQAITLTVGAISAAPEGSPVTLTVGAINPVAEGN